MSKCWYCNNELTTGDSPKHFGICNKCYNEMFKISDTIIRSFTNKIAELQKQLAEAEEHIDSLELQLREQYQLVDEKNEQLAEKEKEIEQLKKFDDLNKTFFNLFRTAFKEPDKVDDLFNTLKTIQEKQDQDKISFAVEQLEMARRRIDRLGYNENKCLNKKDCIEDCLEEIDNQIKELKELK